MKQDFFCIKYIYQAKRPSTVFFELSQHLSKNRLFYHFWLKLPFFEPIPVNIGYQIDLALTLAGVTEIMDSGDFHLELKLNYRTISSQTVDARINIIFQAVTE